MTEGVPHPQFDVLLIELRSLDGACKHVKREIERGLKMKSFLPQEQEAFGRLGKFAHVIESSVGMMFREIEIAKKGLGLE